MTILVPLVALTILCVVIYFVYNYYFKTSNSPTPTPTHTTTPQITSGTPLGAIGYNAQPALSIGSSITPTFPGQTQISHSLSAKKLKVGTPISGTWTAGSVSITFTTSNIPTYATSSFTAANASNQTLSGAVWTVYDQNNFAIPVLLYISDSANAPGIGVIDSMSQSTMIIECANNITDLFHAPSSAFDTNGNPANGEVQLTPGSVFTNAPTQPTNSVIFSAPSDATKGAFNARVTNVNNPDVNAQNYMVFENAVPAALNGVVVWLMAYTVPVNSAFNLGNTIPITVFWLMAVNNAGALVTFFLANNGQSTFTKQ